MNALEPQGDVLIALLGTRPAVLFSAMNAAACFGISPGRVHIVTSRKGLERLNDYLHQFEEDVRAYREQGWQLPAAPSLAMDDSSAQIRVPRLATGDEVQDITTPDDLQTMAEATWSSIAHWTTRPDTAVCLAISGGRKAMGDVALLAMNVHARVQDFAMHVLDDAEEQSRRIRPCALPASEVLDQLIAKRRTGQFTADFHAIQVRAAKGSDAGSSAVTLPLVRISSLFAAAEGSKLRMRRAVDVLGLARHLLNASAGTYRLFLQTKGHHPWASKAEHRALEERIDARFGGTGKKGNSIWVFPPDLNSSLEPIRLEPTDAEAATIFSCLVAVDALRPEMDNDRSDVLSHMIEFGSPLRSACRDWVLACGRAPYTPTGLRGIRGIALLDALAAKVGLPLEIDGTPVPGLPRDPNLIDPSTWQFWINRRRSVISKLSQQWKKQTLGNVVPTFLDDRVYSQADTSSAPAWSLIRPQEFLAWLDAHPKADQCGGLLSEGLDESSNHGDRAIEVLMPLGRQWGVLPSTLWHLGRALPRQRARAPSGVVTACVTLPFDGPKRSRTEAEATAELKGISSTLKKYTDAVQVQPGYTGHIAWSLKAAPLERDVKVLAFRSTQPPGKAEDSSVLSDFATAEDIRDGVDQLHAEVGRITQDNHTRLIASLTGGRKSIGALLLQSLGLRARSFDVACYVARDDEDDGGADRSHVDTEHTHFMVVPILSLNGMIAGDDDTTSMRYSDHVRYVQAGFDALTDEEPPVAIATCFTMTSSGPHWGLNLVNTSNNGCHRSVCARMSDSDVCLWVMLSTMRNPHSEELKDLESGETGLIQRYERLFRALHGRAWDADADDRKKKKLLAGALSRLKYDVGEQLVSLGLSSSAANTIVDRWLFSRMFRGLSEDSRLPPLPGDTSWKLVNVRMENGSESARSVAFQCEAPLNGLAWDQVSIRRSPDSPGLLQLLVRGGPVHVDEDSVDPPERIIDEVSLRDMTNQATLRPGIRGQHVSGDELWQHSLVHWVRETLTIAARKPE